MRCPSCGLAGTGKFCQECATKLVEDVLADQTVLCQGQLENGSLCSTQLSTKQKYCSYCGAKVDLSEVAAKEGNIGSAVNNNGPNLNEENVAIAKSMEIENVDMGKKFENLDTLIETHNMEIISKNKDVDNKEETGETDNANKAENVDHVSVTDNSDKEIKNVDIKQKIVNFDNIKKSDKVTHIDNLNSAEGTDVDLVIEKEANTNLQKTHTNESKQQNRHQEPNQCVDTKKLTEANTCALQKNGKVSDKQTEPSASTKNPNKVTVHFHVLLSPHFKFESKTDKIVIRFGRILGDWNSENWILTHVRTHRDGEEEFQTSIDIPRSNIVGSCVEYRYYIKRFSHKENGERRKDLWEKYERHRQSGKVPNRILRVDERFGKTDTWHQYDGMVSREMTKVWRKLKDKAIEVLQGSTILKTNASIALGIFSDHIVKELTRCTDKDSINQNCFLVHCLAHCMWKVYGIDNPCWDSAHQFINELAVLLILPLLGHVMSFLPKTPEETDRVFSERMFATMALLMVVATLNVVSLPAEGHTDLSQICISLLPSFSVEATSCKEFDFIMSHFSEYRNTVAQVIVRLVSNLAERNKNPSWLFLMPMVHFLFGECDPFGQVNFDLSHDDEKPVWWGTAHLKTGTIETFKKHNTAWETPLSDVIRKLAPCFSLDYMLPRTIMACLNLTEVKDAIQTGLIPLEVSCATTIYLLKTTRPSHPNLYHTTNGELVTFDCMRSLVEVVSKSNTSKAVQPLEMLQLQRNLTVEMTIFALEDNKADPVFCSIALFLYTHSHLMKTEQGQEKEENGIVFTHVLHLMCQWLERYCCAFFKNIDCQLKWWNEALAPEKPPCDELTTSIWNQSILKRLRSCLTAFLKQDAYNTKAYMTYYYIGVQKFKPGLQKCMDEIAITAIDHAYELDLHYLYVEDQCQRYRYGRLLCEILRSNRYNLLQTEESGEVVTLQLCLSWPPLLQFLKIYKTELGDIQPAIFDDNCTILLASAMSKLEESYLLLVNGEIIIGDLGAIYQHAQAFAHLVETISIDNQNKVTSESVLQLINMRMKELDAFRELATWMTTLMNLCQSIAKVDRSGMDHVIEIQKNLTKRALSEICDPGCIDNIYKLDEYTPKLTAFKLSEGLMELLPLIHKCNDSQVFLKIWTDKCEQSEDKTYTIEQVVENIWIPVKESWDMVCQRIQEGDITFCDIEELISNVYGEEDYQRTAEELTRLKLNESQIKARLNQLKQFRELTTCSSGARTLLELSEAYKLGGDFNEVKKIANHHCHDYKMNDMDSTPITTSAFLKEMTHQRCHCLEVFTKCRNLVNWLKESMSEAGLKELKVFVDLAIMSAGDEPMNIASIQCLHSAVTGFAPLIFDLKPTDGFKKLIHYCSVVWKELESNPKLPEQLNDTSRQLEWLKQIKSAHGSVEVTSICQAEAINDNGIYRVGSSAHTEQVVSGHLEHGQSYSLTVAEEKDNKKRRTYSCAQLQDLQSRLMLVAGRAEQGNPSVERFTEIYDSVTRLSHAYEKLVQAGCALFKKWTFTFFCETTSPVCIIVDFGMEELKGHRTENEDLQFLIPQLANFLERCYEEWLKYIKEKRKENEHLNYYTVDQLVILQMELVKLTLTDEPSHLIYPLLSAVKRNCTKADVIESMKEANEELVQESGPDLTTDAVTDATDVERKEKEWSFVQELLDSGYSESLARKALAVVGPDEVSEGISWCMEHEDRESLEEGAPHVSNEEESGYSPAWFNGWSKATESIQTVISASVASLKKGRSVGVKTFLEQLKQVWSAFLSSLTTDMTDYLNLDHLGKILRFLAKKDTFSIKRTLPPGLEEGLPNLIICPKGEVLQTTLGIYMSEKDQPLPQPDEVLLCSRQTTIDEVDIFWRRALFHGARKIHCLVNADLLDFDVSEASERSLEFYLKETINSEPNYRLIIICGSDNESRSRMVSSLSKHRRSTVPHHIKTLKQYLCDKLRVPASTGVKPASYVDFDRSSVRLVKSWRAGVGKTLYKRRMEQKLCELNGNTTSRNVSIPLTEKTIDLHEVVTRLLKHTDPPGHNQPRIFHFDLANEVHKGADFLLFNLLVLGCLVDSSGFVWRKSSQDLYLVETMPLMINYSKVSSSEEYLHKMLALLPEVVCRSPRESVTTYCQTQDSSHDQLFDVGLFKSEVFQRPFQYLIRLGQKQPLNDINPHNAEGSPLTCLQTLLDYCGVHDPSWAELQHFVTFLNTQLLDFERNEFVGQAAARDLPGFSQFVLQFLIQMSKDFSTRSLNLREGSQDPQELGVEEDGYGGDDSSDREDEEDTEETILQKYKLRRRWETSPHPYLFFNADRQGFTFLGFYLDRNTGNLVDQQTETVLQHGIIKRNLLDALISNRVPVQENFDKLSRADKITKLCSVMGNDLPTDPDDTYVLTTDNAKKIMAIFMRFRCNIPVIIMGETGCGKTRLVKFMCSLQCPPRVTVNNMILMKVHGGTTKEDIKRKVKEAEHTAQKNMNKYGAHLFTVLFFDEANTTESIGLIKEVLCDRSLDGEQLSLCDNLKIVAACNPYRKHSNKLIRKLEKAGLGYHVKAEDTTDTLGHVPMRQLVYRVQPIPQSLLPLVWDFGQLNTQVEERYINQMVRKYIQTEKLPDIPGLPEVVSSVLAASQEYMRQQKDECSFVSLRDVDRVLCVMSWFYNRNQKTALLFKQMNQQLVNNLQYAVNKDDNGNENPEEQELGDAQGMPILDITRCLVLSLGVCYHACLRTREEYKRYIAKYFSKPCALPGGWRQMDREINACQEVFLDNVHLEKNIARNMALKENVFMMVVCIELRIPLFLVGKPGSSKSLAKTIVADAMQGNASREQVFMELKQAQMVSFQCSPLSTPDGILGTFRQCAHFQKDKDLNAFVSIVVLDEVGLAEDSPRMPLKTLHPLLEDGCQGDEKPEPYKKVAFIGISNWALDPAKMNRGILVQRDVPSIDELCNSARGICESGQVKGRLGPLIKPMARSYLEIFDRATKYIREFYGLRDFYSLLKMVNMFVERSKRLPTWHEMVHAIKRNFGGMDQVDPVECFRNNIFTVVPFQDQPQVGDPDCSTSGLIQACLFNRKDMQIESRYLLLLTENYSALTVLQQQVLSRHTDIRPITIFGSSFRSDQEYTQVCRNINKIKVCMETGNTVILLNLENLYESLYDALNQYYVYFGGERYVDLGLGTHRVKCPVHQQFRLIVVAEKQTVYKKFPIPLINRLEKHFLTINTMLTERQQAMVKNLEEWAANFVSQRTTPATIRQMRLGDVFKGYHDDTCSAIILHVDQGNADDAQIMLEAKKTLLWCASPDGVVRLKNSNLLQDEQDKIAKIYHEEQSHGSLHDYLHQQLVQNGRQLLSQVTTHSKLLATFHKRLISKKTGIAPKNILLMNTLTSFDTEQQFSSKLFRHFQRTDNGPSLLIIQCDSGEKNANLIACARYCVMDEYETARDSMTAPAHIVFIVQLSHSAEECFSGFQSGIWHSVHIDDLYTEDLDLPDVRSMQTNTIATLLRESVDHDDSGSFSSEPANMSAQRRNENIVDQVMLESGQLRDSETKTYSTAYGSTPKTTQSSHKLILRSIHQAVSMVKDGDDNCVRTTERVSLLLDLLQTKQEKGGPLFLNGLTRMVVKLLEERDKKFGSLSGQWLTNEAASQETLLKTGTFRQACLHTIESKLVPMLAGVISYLDTNQNLDLVRETALPWQQQLWFAFFNHQGIINFKYADLISPLKKHYLPEFTVRRTGCEGHSFNARVPFSWEIHDIVETIVSQPAPQSIQDTMQEHTVWLTNMLTNRIGGVLSDNVSTHMIDEVSRSYVSDLVHMKYHTDCLEEHKLVCDLVQSAQQNMSPMDNRDIVNAIVCSHLAIKMVAKDMTSFRAICNVWPDCSKAYNSLKLEHPSHFLITNSRLVVAATYLLIESLKPKKDGLDPDGRNLWLKTVHKYRPVVEYVFKTYRDFTDQHSFNCLNKTRLLWNRVVIVKLFLEHVCVASSSDNITVNHCMPLWTILKEDADMKTIRTILDVEKFLKSCNSKALSVYVGKIEKCSVCERPMEDVLLIMPCKTKVCEVCMLEGQSQGRCPKCLTPLPDNFQPGFSTTQREAAETMMKDYQRRCNSFFMDAVSQLCFTDNSPPSNEVVTKLLSYITTSPRQSDGKNQGTKPMSVFNTGLDPTPVFRSFLLHHLLRSGDVNELLRQYLEHVKPLLNQHTEKEECNQHFTQHALLVVHCLEDLYRSQAFTDEVWFAVNNLNESLDHLNEEGITETKLCSIAGARMGLGVAADYIRRSLELPLNSRQTQLVEAAFNVCSNNKWPLIYLVKYICRSYGINTFHKLCRKEQYQWFRLEFMDKKQFEVQDRFIILGDTYKTLRECLTRVMLGDHIKPLIETYQDLKTGASRADLMLLLAMYREVTCARLYPADQNKIYEQVIKELDVFVSTNGIKYQDLCHDLVHNKLHGRLCVIEQEDMHTQEVQCLLMHFFCTLNDLQGDCTLIQPLIGLMKNPHQYTRCFMPTMPQDDIEDIKEVLLAARVKGETLVIYRCPNGHPYLIGDCGRPYYLGVCKCGEQIGGQRHKLLEGNIQYNGTDETRTGHVLGPANQLGEELTAERSLTPAQCGCLRLLTHLALYLASLNHSQEMEDLFQPRMESQDISDFLWQHIAADLLNLQNLLGRSQDDVLLIAHCVVIEIMNNNNPGEAVSEETCLLSSKPARRDWKHAFAQKFIRPIMQNADATSKRCNQVIATDQRLGGDPLLCVLYETESSQLQADPGKLQDDDQVWRFRTPISLNHLRLELQNKEHDNIQGNRQHQVLYYFLESEPTLRALKYVPSILRLQKRLLRKYQRRLDRAEASTISIKHLKREKVLGSETEELLEDFKMAWDIARQHLKTYACPTQFGAAKVSEELCGSSVDEETPIAMLLPNTRDKGICSYALIDFLMRKHNETLDQYYQKIDHSCLPSRSRVAPTDVTSSHLISFDRQQDLMPIIYANCQYTFALGKGTAIEYDFIGIERQLMDRFFFSKSKIDIEEYLKIELMVYRTELSNADVFAELSEKIPQVDLNLAVKRQICSEMVSLPEVCESLDHLDIAISFLKSIGGDPSMSLAQFMRDILQMESNINSQKAQQTCQLQHARSLWLLIALQRSKLMLPKGNRKTIMGVVPDEYTMDIPESCSDNLRTYLSSLTIERLSQLVEVCHDFILLKVAVIANKDVEYSDNTEKQLVSYLTAYVQLLDEPVIETSVLDDMPSDILLKHCVHTWMVACQKLFDKQTGRTR